MLWLIDIVVFDYIPFPVLTHTMGMTHFQILALFRSFPLIWYGSCNYCNLAAKIYSSVYGLCCFSFM